MTKLFAPHVLACATLASTIQIKEARQPREAPNECVSRAEEAMNDDRSQFATSVWDSFVARAGVPLAAALVIGRFVAGNLGYLGDQPPPPLHAETALSQPESAPRSIDALPPAAEPSTPGAGDADATPDSSCLPADSRARYRIVHRGCAEPR